MDRHERILFIDSMISSGGRPTRADIMAALESRGEKIDRSTLWRDLRDLREKFHAPLDVVDVPGPEGRIREGFIYTEPLFRVPARFSSVESIRSARLVGGIVAGMRGTPVFDEAAEVFRELGSEAPKVDSRGAARFSLGGEGEERIIFIGSPCVSVPPESWKAIRQALRENALVQFSYDSKKRTVAPYQLIFSNGGWNLWCLDYSRKERRLFSLQKMSDVSKVGGADGKFALPEDFDFRNITSGAFGTFTAGAESRVSVRFRGYAAKHAAARTWGDSQTVRDAGGGWCEISFTTAQLPLSEVDGGNLGGPVLSWILGWGDDAFPVAPERLVKWWKTKVGAMAKMAETAEVADSTKK